jgi:nicotinamidase-related amidase
MNMSATELDPRTALVIIDLQKGLAPYPFARPFREVVANSVRLVEAFRRAQLPIVLVTVAPSRDGGDWLHKRTEMRHPMPTAPEFGELVSELEPREHDIVLTKRQWSAFHGTELDLQLRRRGITGIVLAGVATSIGVDSTARAAHEHSYNLTFAADAISDLDPAAHEHAMTKIFPRLGEIDTAERIVSLLRH